MEFINKLRTALQLGYSVIASPVLVLAERFYPSLHRRLVAPLQSGPYSGGMIDQIWDLLNALQRGALDQESFISEVASRMQEAFEAGELDPYLNLADEQTENLDITLKRCIGFLPLKWWYLKLHFMAPGNVHKLHRHTNVISAQVILQGELLAEQYNLISIDNEDRVVLEQVPVETWRQHQTLLSTDRYCNVHGFEPGPAGAVRFQFYLRGHAPLISRFPKRGRHYIHITGSTGNSGRVAGRLGRTGRAGES